MLVKAHLCLADGRIFVGESMGLAGECVGEVVFNTTMSSYQEVISDAACSGQIIVFTYPLIGNCGINAKDSRENSSIGAKGVIVRELCEQPSNYRAEGTLHSYLVKKGIVGITNVDTRALARYIRDNGSMMGIISIDPDIDALKEKARNLKYCDIDIASLSTNKTYFAGDGETKVALVDFGDADSYLDLLVSMGCRVKVLPPQAKASEILADGTSGVILSNGPGNPENAIFAVDEISKVIKEVPTFGISLGHQLLGLSLGCKTYKMKYGHRGSNHPVRNLETSKINITTQNHGYCIMKDNLPSDVVVTHLNLNDNSIEGIKHSKLPAFSVQFSIEKRPELVSGDNFFNDFLKLVKNGGGKNA